MRIGAGWKCKGCGAAVPGGTVHQCDTAHAPTYASAIAVLTEQDVRRIIREELDEFARVVLARNRRLLAGIRPR